MNNQYKQQQDLKKRPYKCKNAFTLKSSKQQIIGAIYFITEVVLHQVFVTSKIPLLQETVLWIIFGFRYLLLIFIVYDYVKLSLKDPVDRLIIYPDYCYKYNSNLLKNCSICQTTVHHLSYHCLTCNRCTEQFDHHCRFLNNCIGVRNYQYFIRLLFVYVLYTLTSIGIGARILIRNSAHAFLSNEQKGMIIGYLIVVILPGIAITGLLLFHLYLTCYKNTTTIELLKLSQKKKKPRNNVKVIEPLPLSAENFVRQIEHSDNANEFWKIIRRDKIMNQQMEYYRK